MLKNVLIGTNIAYTSASSPASVAAGEIGVFSLAADGTYTLITGAISAAQGLLPIVIAQGSATGNVKSFVINPKAKRAYLDTAYVAPVPNVWNVGYDGTSYDLNNGVAGTYSVSVKNITNGNPPFPSVNASVYCPTVASATSIFIASEAVNQINAQTALRTNAVLPENNFVFANVLSAAVTAAPTSTPTATVTNGSPTVTLSATSVDIVAGAWIKIGAAVTTTYPVYKVKSVSSTTVTLEAPYLNAQQALGTSTAGLTTGFATNATIVAAAAGIRFVEFGNRFQGATYLETQPNLIMNVAVSGLLAGTVMQNNSTVAKSYIGSAGTVTSGIYSEGVGTSAQIFKKELVVASYSGFVNRLDIPAAFPFYTVAGTAYRTFGLQYRNTVNDYTATGISAGDTQEAIIAVVSGASQATSLATILSSANW